MSALSREQQTRLDAAFALHQAGQVGPARDTYRQLAAQQPLNAHVLHLLGLAEHQSGNRTGSLPHFDRSLELSPAQPEAWLNRGNVLLDLGRFDEALASYDKALGLNVKFADAWFSRGLVLTALGRLADALNAYDTALALRPNDPGALANRGNVLQDLARPDEAIASYDKALAMAPQFVDAWINRGNAFLYSQRLDKALESYDRAVALQPQHVLAVYGRGVVLRELKRFDEALAAYDQVIRLQPGYADAHIYRGSVLHELGQLEPAVASYDAALKLQPQSVYALVNRGASLQALERFAEAVGSYEQALAISPDVDWLAGNALHCRMHICDWRDFDAHLKALIEGVEAGKRVVAPLIMQALTDRPDILRQSAELFAAKEFSAREVPLPVRPHHDRIRVAYVSSDFKDHPVSHLIAGLLESHDRSKFEVYAYAIGPQARDAWRTRIEQAVDHFVDVSLKSDREVAQLAQSHEIDIAIDLNGITRNGRPGLFAERIAPAQVSYIGYLGTMGASYIDYLIADAMTVPVDAHDGYVEKIASIPSYQANSSLELSSRIFMRTELGLPEDGFVFCAFNNTYKITPDVFASWMRILQRVPGSVLWLYASHPAAITNLKAQAEAHDVESTRLIFAARAPFADHLARQKCADLFLDTHPYTAGATASSALRVGLPIITLMGQSFAGRMAASVLESAGLPELIAHSVAEYEDLAVRLAGDSEAFANIKRKLAESLPTCALFDTEATTQTIEAAYRAMYERTQAGLTPDHIKVSA